MKIICVYRLHPNKEYKIFDIIPYGAFIAPFYGGDSIHHLVLNTDYDFRNCLENHMDLKLNHRRNDLAPLFFNSAKEAEQYANEVTITPV